MGIPELTSDLATDCTVGSVHGLGRFHMQFAEKFAEIVRVLRRRGDEVVMIREDRPCLKLPAKLPGVGKELFLEKIEPLAARKKWSSGRVPRSPCRYPDQRDGAGQGTKAFPLQDKPHPQKTPEPIPARGFAVKVSVFRTSVIRVE